jgi:hypothetical protein
MKFFQSNFNLNGTFSHLKQVVAPSEYPSFLIPYNHNFLGRICHLIIICGVRVFQSLVFCVAFCKWLVVLLSLFVWPLYCLYFDLRLLKTFVWFFFYIIRWQIRPKMCFCIWTYVIIFHGNAMACYELMTIAFGRCS